MKSRFMKLCSIVLVMILLFNMLPHSALADMLSGEDTSLTPGRDTAGGLQDVSETITEDIPIQEADIQEAEVVGEVTAKRTEYSKEFRLSNGLHMAVVYPEAVHYEADNGWEEIDNTLTAKADGTIVNTAGVWDISFPQQLSAGKYVTVTKDGYTLRFAMGGVLSDSGTAVMRDGNAFSVQNARTSVAQVQQLDNATQLAEARHPETVATKLNARLQYSNVYGNTNVVYDLQSNKLKESVIISRYDSSLRGYRYTLDVGNLVPVLQDDNSIHFYDASKKNVVMTMPAPFMVDADKVYSYDVDVILQGSGSSYTLQYLLPQQWLAAEDRAWPVVLDPVVTPEVNASNIQDVTVAQNAAVWHTSDTVQCGYNSTWGIHRFLVKFNSLPHLTSSDVIVQAEVSLYANGGSSDSHPVEVHQVNSVWQSSGLTWSNAPGFQEAVEDFAVVNGQPGTYCWDVTNIVRSWYDGANTGMLFKIPAAAENSQTPQTKKFISSDYSTSGTVLPALTVYFRNGNGQEGYWGYTSVSAGRAGTGYVNNYTGNLVWVREDMGFGGNRMPVSISHVYNLNDALYPNDSNNANDTNGNVFGLGTGWRTNFNQRIFFWQVNSDYVGWEDSDGTDHYFRYDSATGTYKDEDGLDLTLTVSSGEEPYSITDKLGNTKYYFDRYGRLTRISNNQQTQSHITVTYDGLSYRIATVTDGVGRVYSFTYSNGLLSSINYLGNGEYSIQTVSFTYTGDHLTGITDEDGETCTYSYASGGILTQVRNIDDYTVTYRYNTPTQTYQPYRVEGVAESDYSEMEDLWVDGGDWTFVYAHNQTTVTDHDGNVQVLQFNDYGDVTAVYDDEGRAQFSRYTTDTDPDGTPHQLRSESDLQNTVVNMLGNSSFENGSHSWASFQNAEADLSYGIAYHGSQGLWVAVDSAGIGARENTYSLPAGKTITFSAYVCSTDIPVSLGLYNRADNPVSNIVETGSNWVRLEVSHTNTTDTSQSITPCVLGWSAGEFWVDCVQLELSPIASRYNLADDGDFNDNSSAWEEENFSISTVTPAVSQLSSQAVKLSGTYTEQNSITQIVHISGGAEDTFILGSWGKGNAVPFEAFLGGTYLNERGRAFGLRAQFVYTAGPDTYSPYYGIDFNPYVEDWQYAATEIKAEWPYEAIIISLVYDYGANDVYFDGIQLYEGNIGTSYAYYDNDTLKSVTTADGNATQYTYYDNEELHTVMDPSGVKTTYIYDAYHNEKEVVVEAGDLVETTIRTVYKYEYDTYGNLSTAKSYMDTVMGTKTAYTYANMGNTLESVTDTSGNTTYYEYDSSTNVLNWVQYPEDCLETRTYYSYDPMFRLARVDVISSTLQESSVVYTYTGDQLTRIATPTAEYTIEYDELFGQRTSICVNGEPLAYYGYDDMANRYLSSLDYRNGDEVYYNYDKKGRPIETVYFDGDSTDIVEYTYDAKDNLARMEDFRNAITTAYTYDDLGRQTGYTETGTNLSHSVHISYNALSLPELVEESINGTSCSTTYAYDERSLISMIDVQIADNDSVMAVYQYDALGRVLAQTNARNGYAVIEKTYTYAPAIGTEGNTTHQVKSYNIAIPDRGNITYGYAYDTNGNILAISDGTNNTTYTYDSLNQLIREDNQAGGFTHLWEYDSSGNIICRYKYAYTTGDLGEPDEVVTYSYSSSGWGDILTAYNDQEVTFDSQGRLVNDGSWEYSWTHGRQLASITGEFNTWNFTYDANGMRIQRTGNNKTYQYVYDGSQLRQMTVSGHTLYFTYDASGTPLSVTYDGTTYYYLTNLQGDVIAILSGSGQTVVTYTYDAWGNPVSFSGITVPGLRELNPLRYRGYVYDEETGLYYLQSRYYNPAWGRFISADAYVSTGQGILGHNMFAYCDNNPVNRIDPSGNFWITALLVTGVILVCGGSLSGCSSKPDPAPLPYKTADEAAMAFANSTYSSSSYIRHEYGTVIYSSTTNGTTTYDFATPVAGSPHSVGYGNVKIPSGTTIVATAHTHPNSNSFSGLSPGATSGDIPNAIRRGLDSYVIGPNLNLQKYSISSGTISVVGVATPVVLTSQQQATLVSQFQISWDNHLGTCLFGCEHMTWPTT